MKIEKVKALIARPSIQRRLSAIVTQITTKDYPLQVNIDGGSYTDGKRVVIGVPLKLTEEMLKHSLITSEEQVFSLLKGLSIHEAEHIRSSSFILFTKFQELVEADYLKYNIKGAGSVIGRGIMNAVEDGRIERRAINRLAGVGKHIRFMNALYYKLVGKVKGDMLNDFLLSIVTVATNNLYLMGWKEAYEAEVISKLLEDCVPYIKKGVQAETPEECNEACLKIHELSLPVLANFVNKELDKQQNQNGDSGEGQNFAQDGDISRNPRMDRADRKDAPGNKRKQYSNQKDPQGEKSDSGNSQESEGQGQSQSDSSESQESQSGGQGDKSKEQDSKDSSSKSNGDNGKDAEPNKPKQDDSDSSGSDGKDDDKNSDKSKDGENKDDKDSKSKSKSSKKDDSKSKDDKNQSNDDKQIRYDGQNSNPDKPVELTAGELEELIKEINELVEEENKKALANAIKEDARDEKAAEAKRAQREKNHLTPQELKTISREHRGVYRILTSSDTLDAKSKEVASDLERKLLRIFKNMNTEERRFKRTGNIDKRSLTRLILNKESDVFFQTSKNTVRPAAFCLNIDHSGSMDGDKMKLALRAASICQFAIQKHFPLRVMGFSSGHSETTLYDYKDYDDKANGSLIKFVNNAGNGNCDGYAIEVASTELAKRSEEIKVLIVLSDGYPSVSYKTDALLDAKEAVKAARKAGIIVIAIVFDVAGCNRKNFETIYEKNIIMCEPSEIEKNLAKEIEKIVRVM